MADQDFIDRLERLSLGLDGLEKLGDLAVDANIVVVGAPLVSLAAALQRDLGELIELAHAQKQPRLAHG